MLVSYGGNVGIGTTLGGALRDVLNVAGQRAGPTGTGGSRATAPATGSVNAQIRAGSTRRTRLRQADAALAKKDLATYGKQIARAQRFVDQALSLADQRKASKNGP